MPNPDRGEQRLSRISRRFLDRSARIDYLIAFLIAALPIPLAYWFGLSEDLAVLGEDPYRGYLSAYNFLSLVVILPALLWFVRWAMGRIAPVSEPWPPAKPPPLIELVDSERGKRAVYEALRRRLLSRRLLQVALLIAGRKRGHGAGEIGASSPKYVPPHNSIRQIASRHDRNEKAP